MSSKKQKNFPLATRHLTSQIGVSTATISRWVKQHAIPRHLYILTPGGHFRFSESVIDHLRNN